GEAGSRAYARRPQHRAPRRARRGAVDYLPPIRLPGARRHCDRVRLLATLVARPRHGGRATASRRSCCEPTTTWAYRHATAGGVRMHGHRVAGVAASSVREPGADRLEAIALQSGL